MNESILPDPPAGSELARWMDEGTRLEPSHSNIASVDAPDEPYELRVELDDPIRGYLIDLYYDDIRLARSVADDCGTAIKVVAEIIAAAPELREFDEQPRLGPDRITRTEVESDRETPPVPDEWEDALQEAFDDAEIPRDKGSLVTKMIDDALADSGWSISRVVSGGAAGIDAAGAAWADAVGVPCDEFEPEWEPDGTYDPLAGFKHNSRIIEHADCLLAVWNGTSSGTRDSISRARWTLDDDRIRVVSISDTNVTLTDLAPKPLDQHG